LRKLAVLAVLFALFAVVNSASAQQADAMLGFGTVTSPGHHGCDITTFTCAETGGLYMNLSADVIFHKRVGFGFDAAWRASQGNYADSGQPYRPLLFDFNGVYQPRLGKKVGADLFGGIGWQSTRFYGYQPTSNCVYFGACYVSTNHFLMDAGAGIRYYVWGHVFLRPEIRYYHIVNNTDVFTSQIGPTICLFRATCLHVAPV
jgi:hypothetical protein